jgi:glycosyltransferase involved in cell wall biosynthesis
MARVCIVRAFFVPHDPRVRREMTTLTDAGHSVDVICLRRPGEPGLERNGSLSIRRLPMTHRRGGVGRYLLEYFGFPVVFGVYLTWLDLRHRFDLVQVHSVPDWLVFAAWRLRRRGVPVVLDLHECMPEFFASKFGATLRHPAVRALILLEQASIRLASVTITCTEQMKEAFVSRGALSERVAVVMNSNEETTFDPARFPSRRREDGRFSLICHGTIEERYGIDTIIQAVDQLRERIPGLSLEIYGIGSYVAELRHMVDELGLQRQVIFHGWVPIEELLAGIADADAGVVAMKRDVFRDLTHCNKMFDLITMRRPVICSRTKSVMAYFPNGSLKYFEAGDASDLARAIEELYADPEQSDRLVESASATNEAYRWPRQRETYRAVIDKLLGHSEGPSCAAESHLANGSGSVARVPSTDVHESGAENVHRLIGRVNRIEHRRACE